MGCSGAERLISKSQSKLILVLHGHADYFLERCGGELAVHASDEGGWDAGGADGFAGVVT